MYDKHGLAEDSQETGNIHVLAAWKMLFIFYCGILTNVGRDQTLPKQLKAGKGRECEERNTCMHRWPEFKMSLTFAIFALDEDTACAWRVSVTEEWGAVQSALDSLRTRKIRSVGSCSLLLGKTGTTIQAVHPAFYTFAKGVNVPHWVLALISKTKFLMPVQKKKKKKS